MTDRISQLESFLKESPDDCFLNHALALEYIKLGNGDQARRLFEKNLAHDPAYIATYYHFGKLLERSGETDAALGLYEQGMQQARAAGDRHAYGELQAVYEDLAD